jgi:hypothetical protein
MGPEDFKVKLGGRLLDPRFVTIEREKQPILHAILMDTSASMRYRMPAARKAAGVFISQLETGHERALLISFDDSVVMVHPPSSDLESLESAIDGLRVGRTTSLTDALYYSMLELRSHRERPNIVLLSDGADTSSLHLRDEIFAVLPEIQDLTIFPVSLGLLTTSNTYRFLAELAAQTNGNIVRIPDGSMRSRMVRSFATIREMVNNEAIVTVTDPDPETEVLPLRIKSRNRYYCEVTVFRDHGDPREGASPRYRALQPTEMPFVTGLHAASRFRDLYLEFERPWADASCIRPMETEEGGPGNGVLWYVQALPGRIDGCLLDIVQEPGSLYSKYSTTSVEPSHDIVLKTRSFEMDVPPIDELPRRPVELFDRLARFAVSVSEEDLWRDPRRKNETVNARPYYDHPGILHGRSLLEVQTDLAVALFQQPEYRDWALAKLRDDASREIEEFLERLRRSAPELSQEQLEAVVRASPDTREILLRVARPAPIDIADKLGTWLGDVPAHDIFRRWEAERITRMLQEGGPEADIDSTMREWRELRKIFFAPSYSRILGLAAPGYDPELDRIGFWRVVLPRPGWFLERVKAWKSSDYWEPPPLDLIPEIPIGLWALQQVLASHPDVAAHLKEGSYTARPVTYALLGKPRTQQPWRAFRRSAVEIVLDRNDAGDDGTGMLLRAEVSLGKQLDDPEVTGVEIQARNDPALAELLAERLTAAGGP